jgi:NADH:ubiquinone oxidoreductase subunit 5 (subunit L)/multisubunit Na+/H+ antiporter MnhA subunit
MELLLGVLGLGIGIALAFFLYDTLKRMPAEFRTIEPFFPWLMVIPIVGNVIMIILLSFKMPESFKRFFESSESKPQDVSQDYGKKNGLVYMWSVVACFIPIVNIVAAIVMIVFLIRCVMDISKMKNHLPPINLSNR